MIELIFVAIVMKFCLSGRVLKKTFIYYILFVYEQLQLNVESTKIKVLGSIDHEDDLYAILYTYIRHVEIIPSQFNYKFAEGINTEHLHHHYLILNYNFQLV